MIDIMFTITITPTIADVIVNLKQYVQLWGQSLSIARRDLTLQHESRDLRSQCESYGYRDLIPQSRWDANSTDSFK